MRLMSGQDQEGGKADLHLLEGKNSYFILLFICFRKF